MLQMKFHSMNTKYLKFKIGLHLLFIPLIFFALLYVSYETRKKGVKAEDGESKSSKMESNKYILMWDRGKHDAWGDYGTLLIHGLIEDNENGITYYKSNDCNLLVYLPGGQLVIDDNIKKALERRGYQIPFTKINRVILKDIKWTDWSDLSEPLEYPSTGEPEDYFLGDDFRDIGLDTQNLYWCVKECNLDYFHFSNRCECNDSFKKDLMEIMGDLELYIKFLKIEPRATQ